MNIFFDMEPKLDGVPDDCGPEPSLREIIIHYYSQCFDRAKAEKHADSYIRKLMEMR